MPSSKGTELIEIATNEKTFSSKELLITSSAINEISRTSSNYHVIGMPVKSYII